MKKTVGLTIGAVALAGSGLVTAGPIFADGLSNANADVVDSAAESSATSNSTMVQVADVQGKFSFDQNVVTPNERISSVFNKAASSMCHALPTYVAMLKNNAIAIRGDVDNPGVSNLEEADPSELDTFVMACACATNLAGGGAIANAEVEGVPIKTLAENAHVR